MLIVLSNRQEGKQMPEQEKIESTQITAEEEHGKGHRGPSPSQLAAAVEAAYILEAVRK
jgi:hypothetical protein